NPFKIRAYRNGADITGNHPHDLAVLDESNLRQIPGIGKDLAARIHEIGQTGDAEFHRELAAEFPPSILDVLHLQGVGPKTVATIEPVGSLRRGCDTCGDVDLLAAGAPSSIMDALIDYPLVDRVLGHGDTKSSVLLRSGLQADLRLVAPESRGAAMQYFTGSK